MPGPAPVCGGSSAPTPALGRPSPLPPQPAASAAAGMRPPVPQAACRRRLRRAQLVPASFSPDSPPPAGSLRRQGATATPARAPRRRRAPHLRSGGGESAQSPGRLGLGGRTSGGPCSKSRAFLPAVSPEAPRPAPARPPVPASQTPGQRSFLDRDTVTTIPGGLLPAVSRQPQASQGFMLTDSFLRNSCSRCQLVPFM